jgi:hypothetical protein
MKPLTVVDMKLTNEAVIIKIYPKPYKEE